MNVTTFTFHPFKDLRPEKLCLVCGGQVVAPVGWHRYGCTCSEKCKSMYPGDTPEQSLVDAYTFH